MVENTSTRVTRNVFHEEVRGPYLDVRRRDEPCRGVIELKRVRGDVPNSGDSLEIEGGVNLDESQLESLGHDVPRDSEDIRRVSADEKI